MPVLSLNNLMWIGDIPPELQRLTLTEQKLIARVSMLACFLFRTVVPHLQ